MMRNSTSLNVSPRLELHDSNEQTYRLTYLLCRESHWDRMYNDEEKPTVPALPTSTVQQLTKEAAVENEHPK